MSTRFGKVIQQASTLPAEIQDEIAEQWLEDIENELNWQKTLQQPQDKLAELAREALRQSARGETLVKGFDEILNSPRSFWSGSEICRSGSRKTARKKTTACGSRTHAIPASREFKKAELYRAGLCGAGRYWLAGGGNYERFGYYRVVLDRLAQRI
ncbi:MAG: hypothetical protein MZW92_70820 [Comamonadaceae bacterium]|nr:hypothetical protein [Comamonadaceae bacterium]